MTYLVLPDDLVLPDKFSLFDDDIQMIQESINDVFNIKGHLGKYIQNYIGQLMYLIEVCESNHPLVKRKYRFIGGSAKFYAPYQDEVELIRNVLKDLRVQWCKLKKKHGKIYVDALAWNIDHDVPFEDYMSINVVFDRIRQLTWVRPKGI